jgi:hypothetical protein
MAAAELFTLAAAVYSRGLVGEKKMGSGARDLRDDGTHDEGEQWELWEVSTSDKMFQTPAMARRRRVREGGGVRGLHECAKGRGRGSNSVFKGQRRRGEEAMAGVLAINGRRDVGGLLPSRGGGRLMAEE